MSEPPANDAAPDDPPRNDPMGNDPVATTIFALLAKLPAGKSVSPEDVARAIDPDGWRRGLGRVRATAIGLARAGRLVITRHGKPADPDTFKGVYRLRLPDAPAQEEDAP